MRKRNIGLAVAGALLLTPGMTQAAQTLPQTGGVPGQAQAAVENQQPANLSIGGGAEVHCP